MKRLAALVAKTWQRCAGCSRVLIAIRSSDPSASQITPTGFFTDDDLGESNYGTWRVTSEGSEGTRVSRLDC